jgi:hypothetical protein
MSQLSGSSDLYTNSWASLTAWIVQFQRVRQLLTMKRGRGRGYVWTPSVHRVFQFLNPEEEGEMDGACSMHGGCEQFI